MNPPIRRPNLRRLVERLDSGLDAFLSGHPRLTRRLVRYGLPLLVLILALAAAAGATTPEGRGQQVVYATKEGAVVSFTPASGERMAVYPESAPGHATQPGLNGGSRALAFTVLRRVGVSLSGDLYAADLARGTRALIASAAPGEAYARGAPSADGRWLLASLFSERHPPNVAVFHASGASRRLLEPGSPSAAPLLGPTWTARDSLAAWTTDGDRHSLVAHDAFEGHRATVHETRRRPGPPSYFFDANATVFAEKPGDAGFEESRLVVLSGTSRLPVSGAEGLGLYDPSIRVPDLEDRMAVMWTDGEKTGVGFLDPAGWSFEKTGVEVEGGSRYPQISYDGTLLATAKGGTLTIRRLETGEVVRRLTDLQPAGDANAEMRDAGLDVPPEADDLSPPNFSWRSFETP